ncbi:MAG: type IX secretion system protein PorQ [Bacteroidetes bacterium]|nr:type IX secretion system protein PorQ [Bacteroidota bacterium]
MLRKYYFFLFTFFLATNSFAQIGGSYAFASLDLPMSARAAALGGRAVAINDNDINLATWNPSLLNSSMSGQMALSFTDYISDIKYGYAAFAYHVDKVGTFGLNATRIDYGNFHETDNTGAQIGEFKAGEYGINAMYSRQIDSIFTIGGNLRFIQSNLYLWKANGLSVDLAAMAKIPHTSFTASVLMRNAGVMMNAYTGWNKEKLPFEMEAGIAFKPKHMPFRFNFSFVNLQKWDLTYIDPNNPPQLVDPLTGDSIKTSKFRSFNDKVGRHLVVGGELLIGKVVTLRFGYNYNRRKELLVDTRHGAAGFTFGCGIHVYKFNFSYAHAIYHLAGPTNTFTLTMNLTDFYHK